MATKITKELLDRVLTVETLKKYRNIETQQYFVQEHIDWAYETLIGLTRPTAMRLMEKKHNELMKLGRPWTERNEFVKVLHCIDYELEHSFKVGQRVDYWFSPHTKRTGIIRSIDNRNMARFDDTIVSVNQIVVEEPKPKPKKKKIEKPKTKLSEQISLF